MVAMDSVQQRIIIIKVKTDKAGFSINDSVSSCSPFQVNFTNTSINSTKPNYGTLAMAVHRVSKNPVTLLF